MLDDFAIGERIMVYRKRRGYTMTELANIVGVSKATISKYEKPDFRDYDTDTLVGIAAALNISINKIIYGMEDPNKSKGLPSLIGKDE